MTTAYSNDPPGFASNIPDEDVEAERLRRAEEDRRRRELRELRRVQREALVRHARQRPLPAVRKR